jgi:hypothetical protein
LTVTKFYTLMEIEVNGQVKARLTDSPWAIDISGNIFEPSLPYSLSAIEQTIGLSPNNCKLKVARDKVPYFSTNFCLSGGTEALKITAILYDALNKTRTILDSFYIDSYNLSANAIEFDLLNTSGKLGTSDLSMKATLNCIYKFKGKYCKVDTYPWDLTIANPPNYINAIVNPSLWLVSQKPSPVQFNANGNIEIKLKPDYLDATINTAYRAYTTTLVQNVNQYHLELYKPFYLPLSAIDSVVVSPGCRLSVEDCEFYNNRPRFGGLPQIRGKNYNPSIPGRDN